MGLSRIGQADTALICPSAKYSRRNCVYDRFKPESRSNRRSSPRNRPIAIPRESPSCRNLSSLRGNFTMYLPSSLVVTLFRKCSSHTRSSTVYPLEFPSSSIRQNRLICSWSRELLIDAWKARNPTPGRETPPSLRPARTQPTRVFCKVG